MTSTALVSTDLPLPVFSRGKVRDTYALPDDRLLMVATDRLSAFDWVLPQGIPDRGRVLTQLSVFWFEMTGAEQRNHLISARLEDLPAALRDRAEELEGRFMIVHRAKRIDFECVVRGYLAGSAWAEYEKKGTMAGESLPAGLGQSEKLPEPIFTPATKADDGHDENITYGRLVEEVGEDLASRLRAASVSLYETGARYAETKGLLLADTKFEFGLIGDELILIDEALTPDSSRYWDARGYRIGISPPSYDKQIVRDWLSGTDWDKNSPPPDVDPAVIARTRERYLHAYRELTGRGLPGLREEATR
ncbi:MAG TPA: phosphoribosylaminoimidazolesuccinocarboxamide synthase [Candidatus Dormibacteraeota bacterium]|jgi:phosphoribosylaminoimidazole-succinocarboxamide synthase|nr:phosphoribosylaminoimidazolesuccinocarboxamide synthase [Candidatus Dormibacteraeota bacterium]